MQIDTELTCLVNHFLEVSTSTKRYLIYLIRSSLRYLYMETKFDFTLNTCYFIPHPAKQTKVLEIASHFHSIFVQFSGDRHPFDYIDLR